MTRRRRGVPARTRRSPPSPVPPRAAVVPPRPRAAVVTVVGVLVALLAGPAPLVPAAHAAGSPLHVSLDALSPRVVEAPAPGELVLAGRVTNSGPTPLANVAVGVRRGPVLGADRDVAAALAGQDPAAQVRLPAQPVTDTLAPGASVGFRLALPLRAGAGTTPSLDLSSAGQYPMLLSASAGPGADGSAAPDADSVRFLLPVLDVPPAAPGVPAPPTPAPIPARAERLSVLYPLAERPRRLPRPPGGPVVLTDDDLATSFAPGGRLSGLVDALGRAAPPRSPAAGAVCVAVDADLLDTAAAMVGGYQVAGPSGPVPGTGSAVAAGWLAATRAQLAGRCVVAIPYADADLTATSRGDMADLTTRARTTGATRTAADLGVPVLPDTTWPAGGRLDEQTLSDLATGGARTVVVDGSALARAGTTGRSGPDGSGSPGPSLRSGAAATPDLAVTLGHAPTGPLVGAPLDPLGVRALAGPGGSPEEVHAGAGDLPTAPLGSAGIGRSPAGTGAPVSAQDALAVAVLRAQAAASAPRDAPAGVALLAPPSRWDADPEEAGALLGTVGDLVARRWAVPADLAHVGAPPAGAGEPPAAELEGSGGLPAGAAVAGLDRARRVRDEQRDLLPALVQDRPGSMSPTEFVEPLVEDLLRGLTARNRYDPARRGADVDAVVGEMDQVRSSVRVVQPSGSYSLGSSDAPLLLTVDNRLPVAVTVSVALAPTPGLRFAPIPDQRVPATGSRQFEAGLHVTRSGQFSVDALATTPNGMTLGATSRVLLRSSAYGTITVWLTACAGFVLVTLATVRIVRRIRHSRRPGPARTGPPPPRTDAGTSATPEEEPTSTMPKR